MMRAINRGKLCALKTLLEGDSEIDPAGAAAVIGEVLTDEDFDDGSLDFDDPNNVEDK